MPVRVQSNKIHMLVFVFFEKGELKQDKKTRTHPLRLYLPRRCLLYPNHDYYFIIGVKIESAAPVILIGPSAVGI